MRSDHRTAFEFVTLLTAVKATAPNRYFPRMLPLALVFVM